MTTGKKISSKKISDKKEGSNEEKECQRKGPWNDWGKKNDFSKH